MPLQVCEYMNGGTLSQDRSASRASSRSTRPRASIGAMCAALAEAHALGIVHRDIKPQNILFGTVGGNQLPKLADFGIAKWSADDRRGQRAARRGHRDRRRPEARDVLAELGRARAARRPAGQRPRPTSTRSRCVAIYMLSGKAIFADEDVYAGYKKRRHADELVRDALRPLDDPEQRDRAARAGRSRSIRRSGSSKVDELAAELVAALEPPTEEQSPARRRRARQRAPASTADGAAARRSRRRAGSAERSPRAATRSPPPVPATRSRATPAPTPTSRRRSPIAADVSPPTGAPAAVDAGDRRRSARGPRRLLALVRRAAAGRAIVSVHFVRWSAPTTRST